MAFFNYSTMQMTAKIVYYGPGLGGKTTNLEYIYGHTTNDSRGEMVSLETQTDRTLFFDLLPMEVGTIAGFKARIQLYTVPGQVFYNSTRKLVLKGVDGVVFVADSQKPMMHSNVESLANLEENLTELGLSSSSLPIVLQYNKRDLPDIAPVDELEKKLNTNSWTSFEASALTGLGVFETLRAISKLTLISLRGQLEAAAAGEMEPSVSFDRTEAATRPASDGEGAASQTATEPADTETARRVVDQKLRRDFILRLPEDEFGRAATINAQLKVLDEEGKTLRASQALSFEIDRHPDLEEVMVRLSLKMKSEG